MSAKLSCVRFRKFSLRVVCRIALTALLLTAGVKLTNMLLRLRFFTDLGLKVYPRKSNCVIGYFFVSFRQNCMISAGIHAMG